MYREAYYNAARAAHDASALIKHTKIQTGSQHPQVRQVSSRWKPWLTTCGLGSSVTYTTCCPGVCVPGPPSRPRQPCPDDEGHAYVGASDKAAAARIRCSWWWTSRRAVRRTAAWSAYRAQPSRRPQRPQRARVSVNLPPRLAPPRPTYHRVRRGPCPAGVRRQGLVRHLQHPQARGTHEDRRGPRTEEAGRRKQDGGRRGARAEGEEIEAGRQGGRRGKHTQRRKDCGVQRSLPALSAHPLCPPSLLALSARPLCWPCLPGPAPCPLGPCPALLRGPLALAERLGVDGVGRGVRAWWNAAAAAAGDRDRWSERGRRRRGAAGRADGRPARGRVHRVGCVHAQGSPPLGRSSLDSRACTRRALQSRRCASVASPRRSAFTYVAGARMHPHAHRPSRCSC